MNLKFYEDIKITDDLKAIDRVQLFIGEFVGTAILMIVGCYACAFHDHETPRRLIESAFGFGIAVLIAVQVCGHVSGSHINPIITLASFIVGDLALIEVPLYFLAQVLGSFAGFGFLKLVIPEELIYGAAVRDVGICAVSINPKLTDIQGMLIEATIAFILTTSACSVWDHRNTNHDSVPLKFGLIITIIVLAAGEFTSAHLNPARTIAPAVLNGYFKRHWVLYVGPTGGAAVASLIYAIVFH